MKNSVRLGLMPPLTGLVGLYGFEISTAGKIACKEVNESGGVLGRPLELIIEDDRSLPDTAVKAAEKLLDYHHCVALIGNLLSNSRIAVAYQVAEPRKIPFLNFSFSEGSILSRYFFHFAALPNQQIDHMIPYMKNKYGPKMFFAGNNYEWPRGSIDAAKIALERSGGVVVGEEYLPIGSEISELEKLVNHLEQSGADVFVPYFAGNDQVNLLTIFTEKKLKDRISVVMGHYDEAMARVLSPEVREGFYSSNTYFMTVDTAENRHYLKQLASMPGIDGVWPNGNGVLTNFGEGTYLCVKAFAMAANMAGSLAPEDLVSALETIRLSSPQGLVQMDKKTHYARVNTYLSQCQANGVFTIIENFGSINPIIPERYQHLKIRSQAALEDEIRLQARILEQLTEGVGLVQVEDGTIIYSNHGFDTMFGYGVRGLVGKHISITYAPTEKTAQEIAEEINALLYRKGVWEGEIKSRKKDGTEFWCATTISAFTHAEYGEVLMAVYKDITQQKQNDEILVKAKQDSERANQAKSLFLASMSHEIRTPMNAIIGMAELLSETELTDEQKKYVRVFKGAGESLLSLINDILDVSKIESNEFELDKTAFNLTKLIESCLDIVADKARQNNIELQFETDEEDFPTLFGDALRLRQVLINLLGNAIKFTEKGGVFLNVKTGIQEGDILSVLFVIRDTGIGISEDQKEKIFSAFTQAATNITKVYGGTGLGLTISRQIITKMGGKIDLKSSIGGGSTFTVQIPFEVSQKAGRTSAAKIRYPMLQGKKILLWDLKQLSREFLVRMIKSAGSTVHIADESTIISLLEEEKDFGKPYHALVIVCDGNQDQKGCAFAMEIKNTLLAYSLPILTISDHPLCDKLKSSESKTVNCSIVKPVKRRELLTALADKIALLKPSAPVEQKQLVVESTQVPLKLLLVDDNQDNRLLAMAFLKKLPYTITVATNGAEAFEKFKESKFDLVLMDIQMPVMDGYTAMRKIRTWESSNSAAKTPIVALTAYAMKEDKEKCLAAGADGYLSKPVKKNTLITSIQEYASPGD